jgi:serine/threonine-protein kinase
MARGPFYVIIDFVAGETLADHVQRYCAGGDLRPAVEMLARCAERVGALHAAGCAHGRLTPGNVLIDRDGQPHLLDVAQAALHGTAQVAEAGQPHSRRQGATADVLALGVLFDEALGRAPSAAGRARLPAALAEVLRPCRDADPLRRYATAGELAEALRRWLAPEAPQTPPHRPASRVQRLQQGLRRFLRRTSDGPPPGL